MLTAILFCMALGGSAEVRVLLVGDSWADYMWQDRVLRQVFAAEGRPDIIEEGSTTTISGSTAAEWAQPEMLALITQEVMSIPSLTHVQLTMGGNDFLAGASGGGWHTGMTPLEEETLFMRVAEDIQTVIEHILDIDPRLDIVISLYDYPNFVETLSGLGALFCVPLHQDLGEPMPETINSALADFTAELALILADRLEVTVVDHAGHMQNRFGYPSMGISPGDLIPPGDLTLPSPPESLRFGGNDCFHLNATGYRYLAQNLWDRYYGSSFCRTVAQILSRLASWPLEADITHLADDVTHRCGTDDG